MKQGLKSTNKHANMLQIKAALEQGKFTALALVQSKKQSKLAKKMAGESGLAGILQQKDEAAQNARRNARMMEIEMQERN